MKNNTFIYILIAIGVFLVGYVFKKNEETIMREAGLKIANEGVKYTQSQFQEFGNTIKSLGKYIGSIWK